MAMPCWMLSIPTGHDSRRDRTLPATGVDRSVILDELTTMASEEDAKGDLGLVSGSIYHGDHDHYHFLNEAFERSRARQRPPT